MKRGNPFKFGSQRFRYFLLVAFGLVIIYFNLRAIDEIPAVPRYKSQCDLDAAKYLIEDLCDQYSKQKLAEGSMCAELCKPSNKFSFYKEYELVGCENSQTVGNRREFFAQFKAVLVYERKGGTEKNKRMVLKSRHQFFLDADTHMDFDFKQKPMINQLKFLLGHFKNSLSSNFGVKISRDALNWLEKFSTNPKEQRDLTKQDMFYYIDLFAVNTTAHFEEALRSGDKHRLAVFIHNLVILMYQDEYLFYRFFQHKPDSLKIYGSCGHFYAVEYAKPLGHLVPLMSIEERKALAIKFLGLVHNLDRLYLANAQKAIGDSIETEASEKPQKLVTLPMQICDVKLDNFGLNEAGELKIIDTDMVHPDSYLFNEKVCLKHEDCHFFECKSFCDPESKKCTMHRVNNNLQSICEKIFDNQIVKEDALLTSVEDFGSNVHAELMRRVESCVSPGFYHNSDVPVEANLTLIKVLEVLLRAKSVNTKNGS